MIQWQLHNNNDDDDNSANAHPAHSVRTEQIVGVWVDHVSFELHLAGDAAVCGVRDVSRFLTDRPNKSQEISTGGRIDLLVLTPLHKIDRRPINCAMPLLLHVAAYFRPPDYCNTSSRPPRGRSLARHLFI